MTAKKVIEKNRTDTIDIVIFFLLSLFSTFFTLGSFTKAEDESQYNSGFYIFDRFFSYNPGKATNLYIFIPALIIYLALLVWFINLRYQKTKKQPSKYLLAAFLVFVVSRLISTFSFPYGEEGYIFTSPFDQSVKEVIYSGYDIKSRIISLADEILFYSYFFIVMDYIKTFSKGFDIGVRFFLFFFIALGVVANIYSYITEANLLKNNLEAFFVDHNKEMLMLVSFTSNRNIYGFLLFMAYSSCFVLAFTSKPNIVYGLLAFYFMVSDLFIYSRTPFGIMVVLSLVWVSIHAFTYFKEHRGYSILDIVVLSFVALVFILAFTAFRNSSFTQGIVSNFLDYLNLDTLFSRNDCTLRSLSMLNSPYYWIFGYGRYPFITIQNDYGLDIYSWTSHNSYVDMLMFFGILGLIMLLAFFMYPLYQEYLLIKKKDSIVLAFIALNISYLVYSYYEPRMLFLMEGCNIFFLLIFLFPLSREALLSSKMKETDINSQNQLKKELLSNL